VLLTLHAGAKSSVEFGDQRLEVLLTLDGRLARACEDSSADRGQKLAAAVTLGIPPDILAPSAGIGTRGPAPASQNIARTASASRQGERKKNRRNYELHRRIP